MRVSSSQVMGAVPPTIQILFSCSLKERNC